MHTDTHSHPSLTHCQIMLQELITLKKHSVAWIAKACHLSPSVLHNILKGNTRQPKPSVFRKILLLYCWCFYRPGIK